MDEIDFFSPAGLLLLFASLTNEIIDYLGALLNVSGVWAVIVFILNLITLFFVIGLKLVIHGFSFSSVVSDWKQALALGLEFFPGVGDLVPGFLGYLLLGKKKKAPSPSSST